MSSIIKNEFINTFNLILKITLFFNVLLYLTCLGLFNFSSPTISSNTELFSFPKKHIFFKNNNTVASKATEES